MNDGEVNIFASLILLKQKIVDMELKMQHDQQRIDFLERRLDHIKTVNIITYFVFDFNLLFKIKK